MTGFVCFVQRANGAMGLCLDDLERMAGSGHVCRDVCPRSEESQLAYNYFCNAVLTVYASFEDFVLRRVFKYPPLKHGAQSQIVLVAAPAYDEWVLAKMPFPYDLLPNIRHFVLWRNNQARDMELAGRLIEKEFSHTRVVWFATNPRWCTVPGLFHVHIFF